MNTDHAWVRWGQQDPYYAVITNPKFRSSSITSEAKHEFFESGRHHLAYVLDTCRKRVDEKFAPKRALDFGCGVGRVVVHMAAQFESVVGIDVSPAMLAEARANCQARGFGNVELIVSDDTLSAVTGSFDLVHSCIVFQHIDVNRGRRLFERLLEMLAPGGVGAIQVTYAKAYHPETYGQPPAPSPAPEPPAGRRLFGFASPPAEPAGDPEMQMNPYALTELAFMLQRAGVQDFYTQFTDHGGEWGVFLFFRKP